MKSYLYLFAILPSNSKCFATTFYFIQIWTNAWSASLVIQTLLVTIHIMVILAFVNPVIQVMEHNVQISTSAVKTHALVSFSFVLIVSDGFWGPGSVKTAPGDVLGRVLTKFHPHRTMLCPDKPWKGLQQTTSPPRASVEIRVWLCWRFLVKLKIRDQ